MGKRGPVSKNEYVGQTAVLSTRLTPELRRRLEDEVAKKPNNTISREVEKRIRASFVDDDKIVEAFGSRQNYALMKVICGVLQLWHDPSDMCSDWTADPTAYDQVCRKINNVLKSMRPVGKARKLSDLEQVLADGAAIEHPSRILVAVSNADPAIPLSGPRSAQILSRIQGDLGPMLERAHIFKGTAEQLRAEAARLEEQESANANIPEEG